MSNSQSFLIAPYEVGLELDKSPWLLTDNAFVEATDAYIYKKTIRKRIDNKFLGRLVEQVATVTDAGAVSNVDTTYTNGIALPSLPVGKRSIKITLNAYIFFDDGEGNLEDGANTSGTINYETGIFTINFPAIGGAGPYDVVTEYGYNTCRPVMGLRTWESNIINQERLIAFDTIRSNLLNNTTGGFDDINFFYKAAAPFTYFDWTGSDSDFYFSTNYQSGFFATNGTFGSYPNIDDAVGGTGDGIRVYVDNGAGAGTDVGWLNFNPPLSDTAVPPYDVLKGCRLMFPYKNRMVVLSTFEGPNTTPGTFTSHRQRARWSQNGTIWYDTTGLPTGLSADAEAWRSDIFGRGGFADAATEEQIVGAEFIRDTLIVYFERSTWQLKYTNDETRPFIWIRVNTELGCESTFSVVGFDTGVFGVGDRGIVTTDSNNTQRIDLKIPDTVFTIKNDQVKRVHGIRNYYQKLVYWIFPDQDNFFKWPNKMLVLNYDEGAYSIYNDSYTCLGYAQLPRTESAGQGYFWNTTAVNWDDASWNWDDSGFSGVINQSYFPDIVAGTNQGYVMILDKQSGNGTQLSITAISQADQAIVTTCGDHNLQNGQFIKITNVQGMTEIEGENTQVQQVLDGDQNPVSNQFLCLDINSTDYTAYTVGGDITRINQFNILTKRFNPFISNQKGVHLNYSDFYVNSFPNGRFNVDIYVSGNSIDAVNVGIWQEQVSTDFPDTNFFESQFWTRFYCNAQGQFIQFRFYRSDEDALDDSFNTKGFILNGMLLNLEPDFRLV